MIRHRLRQTQATEPAVREVQMYLLTQTALRANAKTVAYDQHPNHQLRIDRRPASVTVERHQVSTQLGEIEETIDATQQVIRRYVVVEIKGIKE